MKTSFFKKVFIVGFVLALGGCCDCPEEPVEPPVTPVEYSAADHLRMYFETLHPKDQRAMFRQMPYQTKYALMSSHLNNRLSLAEGDEEVGYIQGIIDFLKPEHYMDTALMSAEGMEFLSGTAERGLEVYEGNKERLSEVLYKIGGDENADIIIAVWQKPDCECNMAIDLCVFGDCGPFDCTVSVGGCGPVWAMPCDGMCLIIDE